MPFFARILRLRRTLVNVLKNVFGIFNYYVDSVNGNDSHDGTNKTKAWKTLAKVNGLSAGIAVSKSVGLTGTFRETLNVPASNMTFGSYGSGATITGAEIISSSWIATTSQISSSVTQSNLRLNTLSGSAFLDLGISGSLTPYIGSKITITDINGKQLVGYIQAAGTGETYGSELSPNTSFNNTTGVTANDSTLASVSGGNSGNCLQVTSIDGTGGASAILPFTAQVGALYHWSAWAKNGTSGITGEYAQMQSSPFTITGGSNLWTLTWAQNTWYSVAPFTAMQLVLSIGGTAAGQTAFFDDTSIKQVLTPSSTGVTIVSTPGGSTFNWASMDAGFLITAPISSGDTWTYSISSSPVNVWQTTVTKQPNLVLFNGVSGISQSAVAGIITSTNWYWASSSLYVYSSGSPSTVYTTPGIEVGNRAWCVGVSTNNNIKINGLDLRNNNGDSTAGIISAAGGLTGLTVTNCTFENGVYDGIGSWQGAATDQGNFTIVNNTFTGMGRNGINIGSSAGTTHDFVITGNTFVGTGLGATMAIWLGAGTSGTASIQHNNISNMGGSGIVLEGWTSGSAIITNNNITQWAQSTNDRGGIHPISNSNVNFLISTNAFSNSGGNGQGAALYLDTFSTNSVVVASYNTVINTMAPGLQIINSSNCICHHNLLINTAKSNVFGTYVGSIHIEAWTSINCTANLFYNNTVYNSGSRNGYGIDTLVSNGGSGVVGGNVFKNNIIYHQLTAGQQKVNNRTDSTAVFSNNLYYPTIGTNEFTYMSSSYSSISAWNGVTNVNSELNVDPQFNNISGSDFSLQSTSPAKEYGAFILGDNDNYTLDLGAIPVSASTLKSLAAQLTTPITMGAVVSATALASDTTYGALLAREYNLVVPENAMKFKEIHPSSGSYTFTDADALVAFAQTHSLAIHGHNLIWPTQPDGNPTWITGGSWTSSSLLAVMQSHISTVVGRYAGKIATWDVVNEPLVATGLVETTSKWATVIGSSYIDAAFIAARIADPTTKLYINEEGTEWNSAKADGLYTLVTAMIGRGTPIDGVGFECHVTNDAPNAYQIYTSLKRFSDLGLDVRVSEFDVRIDNPSGSLTKQASVYQQFIQGAMAVPRLRSFTTWGFTDTYSWVSASYSGFGRALPFNSTYAKKPAYNSLYTQLALNSTSIPVSTSLWTSDFETETNLFSNEWGGVISSSGDTVTIQSAVTQSGTQAAMFTYGGTSTTSDQITHTLYASDTEVYVRAYVQFNSTFALSGSFGLHSVMSIVDASGNELMRLAAQNASTASLNQFNWWCKLPVPGNIIYSGTQNEITKNTWHEVCIHWKAGSGSNGGGEFFWNGVSKASNLALNQSSSRAYALRLGDFDSAAASPKSGSIKYYDNVAADSQWIPTNYYVDSISGSDSNTGISALTPWATVAKVNSSSFKPGDSINFNKGAVWHETLVMPSSGTSTAPITVSSYGTGAAPTFDGGQVYSSWTSESISTSTSSLKDSQTAGSTGLNILNASSRLWAGTYFTAGSTYALGEVDVELNKVGSPTMHVTCYIYSDNGSTAPGTLFASSSTSLAASTIVNGTYYPFSFDGSKSLVSGTKYWIILKGDAESNTNYVQMVCATFGSAAYESPDGTTWDSIGNADKANFKTWSSAASITAYYATTANDPHFIFDGTVPYLAVAGKTSLAVGNFWYDSTDARVYVRTTGDNNPSGYTITGGKLGTSSYGLLDFNQQSYVTFNGLNARYSKFGAIHNWASASGQTNQYVVNCTASYCGGGGIILSADTVHFTNPLISGCLVHDCNLDRTAYYESITIMCGLYFTVANCEVHHHVHEGIDCHGGNPGGSLVSQHGSVYGNYVHSAATDQALPGIYFDGADDVSCYNNVVTGQVFTASPFSMGIMLSTELAGNANTNMRIYGNLLYNNNIGIELQIKTGTTPFSNISIVGNSIIGSSDRGVYFDTSMTGHITGSNQLSNNLFWGSGVSDIYDATTSHTAIAAFATMLTNLFQSGVTSDTQGTSPVVTSDTATQVFANYSANNFALVSGSPALAAGTYVAGMSTTAPPNIGSTLINVTFPLVFTSDFSGDFA